MAENGPLAPQAAWVRGNALPLHTVEAGHGFDDLGRLETWG
jgi:hypothetical protein